MDSPYWNVLALSGITAYWLASVYSFSQYNEEESSISAAEDSETWKGTSKSPKIANSERSAATRPLIVLSSKGKKDNAAVIKAAKLLGLEVTVVSKIKRSKGKQKSLPHSDVNSKQNKGEELHLANRMHWSSVEECNSCAAGYHNAGWLMWAKTNQPKLTKTKSSTQMRARKSRPQAVTSSFGSALSPRVLKCENKNRQMFGAMDHSDVHLSLPLHGYSDDIILTMSAAMFFRQFFFFLPFEDDGVYPSIMQKMSVSARSMLRRQKWYASLLNSTILQRLLLPFLESSGLMQYILYLGIVDIELSADTHVALPALPWLGNSSNSVYISDSYFVGGGSASARQGQDGNSRSISYRNPYVDSPPTWGFEYQANWL